MVFPVIQTLLLVIAGGLLFRLWRAAAPDARWLRLVVAAGFLGRAVVGQVLFWISWARLPVGRSMQIGDGLWFFARDARVYLPFAADGARNGLWAIVTFDRTAPSVSYIQALGTSMLLFGWTTSVALLLNLFCFLGMIAILLHWSRNEPRTRVPVAVAVAGISLSPAFMLWSLQPLKDSFFQFLVVAFIAACAAWQRAWVAERRHPATHVAVATLLFVLLFAIAGIRWYFAFAMLIAASIFLLLTIFRTRGRRLVAAGSAIVMALVLSRAFVLGGGPYIPPTIHSVLQPSTALQSVARLPSSVLGDVDRFRDGFERSGGSTAIKAGERLSRRHAPAAPVPAATASAATPTDTAAASPSTPAGTTTAPATAAQTATKPASAPVAATTATTAPSPVPVEDAPASEGDAIQKSTSRVARLVSGAAAVVLPRVIGESLGLFQIGGGRGMFWFTELDTLVFDAVLIFAIAALVLHFSPSLRNPLAWFVVLLTLLAGIPLVYTITNFGTLFRLREMIYLGVLLAPLAVATSAGGEKKHEAEVSS